MDKFKNSAFWNALVERNELPAIPTVVEIPDRTILNLALALIAVIVVAVLLIRATAPKLQNA